MTVCIAETGALARTETEGEQSTRRDEHQALAGGSGSHGISYVLSTTGRS